MHIMSDTKNLRFAGNPGFPPYAMIDSSKQALIYNKCLLLTVEAFLPSKFSDLYILFGWIFHTSTNFVLHTYIHVKHCLHGLAQLFCSLPFYFQEVAQAIVLPIVTYPLLTQDRPATGDILPETAGLRGYIQ